uniref:PurM-like N-terminal domain-containing protein n=1 Tax=Glossina pallidipes TaxID=7398 RepID=A0A1A9Z1K3_GLOPL
MDTLVLNTHFLEKICPFDLGYKSVSVNLSDLAAVGASPKWLLLSLTMPFINEFWIDKYSKGLFHHLNIFNVKLIGGDLSTLGDSAAGLSILMDNLCITDKISKNYLIKRHTRPVPRIHEGIVLRHLVNAACDISDGTVVDLQNILNNSQCGAKIYLDRLPISSYLLNNVEYKQAISFALYGGEDYEL